MLHLDHRDARPIYEQVRDGLRDLIVAGAIEPGEKLPSVRALAGELAINPNTIQRAYTALEDEGYLITERGRGVFAADGGGGEERKRELLEKLDALIGELLFLGVSVRELVQRVEAREGGYAT